MGEERNKYKSMLSQAMVYFVPAFTIISIIIFSLYYHEKHFWYKEIDQNLRTHIEREKTEISSYLRGVFHDLSFLVERTETIGPFDNSEKDAVSNLTGEFSAFSRNHPLYQQIRFLNTEGDEVIRVDLIQNQTIVCPAEKLQNKKHRYYFTESIILDKGQVYMSKLDLNIENKEIEVPFNPMLRFAAPVFDKAGTKKGVVILNYKSDTFLEKLEDHPGYGLKANIQSQLLNSESFWLHNIDKKLCWGFMLDDRTDFKMSKTNPDLWNIINTSEQGLISNKQGRFAYDTIYPAETAIQTAGTENINPATTRTKDHYWKIIAFLPNKAIAAYEHKYMIAAWAIFASIAVLLLFTSLLLARKNSQKKEAEEKYRILYESSMDAIMLLDNTRFISGNPAAIKMFGCKNEKEFTSFHPTDLSPEYQPDGELSSTKAQKIIETTYKKGNNFFEWRHKSTDGKDFDASVQLTVTKIKGEKVLQVTIRDITEQKRAQRQIEENIEMKTKFVSTASHELRTPLTAIKEGINIVYSGMAGQLNDEQKEFLEIAKRNVDRLARLINDVLDFQKISAGKMDFDIKPNNINEAVKQVVQTMKPWLEEKNLDLITDLNNNIENFNFDSDKIIQVLTNLVNNAIKFTDNGGIKISTSIHDGCVVTSVQDTGSGIKQENMPKLFNEFEQFETRDYERKIGGTGLGLAICKKIIENHNGTIWATSEYGKGTIFCFQLPMEDILCQLKS